MTSESEAERWRKHHERAERMLNAKRKQAKVREELNLPPAEPLIGTQPKKREAEKPFRTSAQKLKSSKASPIDVFSKCANPDCSGFVLALCGRCDSNTEGDGMAHISGTAGALGYQVTTTRTHKRVQCAVCDGWVCEMCGVRTNRSDDVYHHRCWR